MENVANPGELIGKGNHMGHSQLSKDVAERLTVGKLNEYQVYIQFSLRRLENLIQIVWTQLELVELLIFNDHLLVVVVHIKQIRRQVQHL